MTSTPATDPNAITISRHDVQTRLGKTFTDTQWQTFTRHAVTTALDELADLGAQIITFGRPGQDISADSAEIGDVILDQNGHGPYTVVDVDMPSSYLRFTFRRADGSEFTDTAAMEATFTCVGGPSYGTLTVDTSP